ncbi:hypothetical protein J3R82DRAFT_2735 [Butyriboletus roseoflavus]|nr:hypothetical protein J3R82DRAFT_2735 [Butyriboletus roseoflavus]
MLPYLHCPYITLPYLSCGPLDLVLTILPSACMAVPFPPPSSHVAPPPPLHYCPFFVYCVLMHSWCIKDLPDPSTCGLLLGLQLASVAASVVCAIPMNLVLLSGYDLGFPLKVITVMKANWSSHIPLNALSTASLLAVALSLKDDSYQNISVGDGGNIKLIAPKLNEKEELLMTPQNWLHAHPCLVACIRQFLPGPADAVTDMWVAHFNLIYNRVDFFSKFNLYLVYDICLRHHYVYDMSFTPSTWQRDV